MLLGVNELTRLLRMPGSAIISWLAARGQWREGYEGATQNEGRCAHSVAGSGESGVVSPSDFHMRQDSYRLQHPGPKSSQPLAQKM